MEGLVLHAIGSGFLFGVWPLIMQRSGITNVYISTAIMEAIVFLTLLPLGLVNLHTFEMGKMSWTFTVLASVSAAFGVLIFNAGLARSTPTTVSTFFVVMILVQVVVPATYHLYMNGGVTTSKLLGFAFAGLAAYFLSK